MAPRKKISDEQILAALSEHENVAKAAKSLDVTINAIYSRLDTDDLRGRWRKQRYRKLETELDRVLEKVPSAIKTLHALARNSGPHDSVRMASANQILTLAMKLREQQGGNAETDRTWDEAPDFKPRLVGAD